MILERPHLMQIREFQPDHDYDMICKWCADRRRQPSWHRAIAPPLEILPPIGIIVYRTDGFYSEDLAAMWLYLAQGTPVCFAEHCATKPGLLLATAKLTIITAEKYLEGLAYNLGYRLMVAHVLPGMARYMQHMDWYRGDGDLIAMWTHADPQGFHLKQLKEVA